MNRAARLGPGAARAFALAAATAFYGAGCPTAGEGGQQPLAISLEFDPSMFGACFSDCSSIDDCQLSCGGVVGLFLADAESGALLDQSCKALAGGADDTLRMLPAYLDGAELVTGVAIGRRVVVEVAVYSPAPFVEPGDAGPGPTCPRPKLEQGVPVYQDPTGAQYPAYWGRSDPLTVRADENLASITMGCVSDFACQSSPDEAVVSAQVQVLESRVPASDPEELDVRFGYVSLELPELTVALFKPLAELLLEEPLGSPPRWSKLVKNPFLDPTCLGTLVTRVGANTGYSVLSCEGTAMEASSPAPASAETKGYTIDKAFVDALLPRLGLAAGQLPEHGILIGRVVDAIDTPLAGATVTPLQGEATVIYLDAIGQPISATATSTSGWFVVATPPTLQPVGSVVGSARANCCEVFQAEIGSDIACTPAPVGLVDGVVMSAPIKVIPGVTNGCDTPP